jgi:streptogramin lyase
MKPFWIVFVTLLIVGGALASDSPRTLASGQYRAAAKRACKTVTKQVHGKKKRVKVCKTVKPKPAPTPTGTPLPSRTPFGRVLGIAVDAQGNIYVAAWGSCRVEKLSPMGTLLQTFEQLPVADCDDSALAGPTGIAVDGQGNVYVTRSHASADLTKFSPGGQILLHLGSSGSAPGQFDEPRQVAVNGQGVIAIADGANARVQLFSPDGTFLAARTGDKDIQFSFPVGVAFDRNGTLYVSEHRGGFVFKLAPDGTSLARFGGGITFAGEVAVDSEGNIYLNTESARFVKFSPTGKRTAFAPTVGPFAVAVDPGDDVWAANCPSDTVCALDKFAPDGRLLLSWAGPQ